MRAAFRGVGCPPWTRMTTSRRRMPSLRDESRDGHASASRGRGPSPRAIQDPRWRCRLARGSHEPLADLRHELLRRPVLAHGAQGPRQDPGPPASRPGPVAASPTASRPGLTTSTSPSQGEVDQHGAAERDLELLGLRLARLVVEQEEQQVLCDQRHRIRQATVRRGTSLLGDQHARGDRSYGTGPAAAAPPTIKRVRTHHLREMKERGERFSMLTAYEQYAAQTFDEAGIQVLLVGDSASNNVYGNETSLPVTVDELIPLTRAVTPVGKRRWSSATSLRVLPALARAGLDTAVRFMKEGGAHASSSRAAARWRRRSSC